MPVDALGERVDSVKKHGDRVSAALDLLLARAWD